MLSWNRGVMSGDRKRGTRPPAAVQEEILALFSSNASSEELRIELDLLANEWVFGGLTHVWGPLLYQRAPRAFKPFILRHFSSYMVTKGWNYKEVKWKGEVAQRLEAWLVQVDSDNEVELFKRLYQWKTASDNFKKAAKNWQQELLSRFRKASDTAARKIELSKLDLWYWLDQDTAIALYQTDRKASADFILYHLPRGYSLFSGEKRNFWEPLAQLALDKGDEDFYFRLYRQQIPIPRWTKDVVELCRKQQDTKKLLQELEKRHPATWSKDLGSTICKILEIRGKELFPYVIPRLQLHRSFFFRDGFDQLIELANQKDWLDLWAALLRRHASSKEYNKAVLETLRLSDSVARRRLCLLAGIGQEWNFGGLGLATAQGLSDKVAIQVYQRFPELLRGPLKVQLNPNWSETYSKLIDLLMEHNDEELLDYLASRFVWRDGRWGQRRLLAPAEKLAVYFESLQSEPIAFAKRAANVAGQVPPFAFWNYRECIRSNRLTRLLYERKPESYLASESALQDLIEAPEIHAQHLAYKALSCSTEKAAELAQANLQLLLGTLLRPLHRRTRLTAFKALRNACRDEETSDIVLQRARLACDLPDRRYPKDDLVGLMGAILYQWPNLRTEDEQPVVYGAERC